MKKLRLTLSANLLTYPETARTKAGKAAIDAAIVADLETLGHTVIRRTDGDDAHAFGYNPETELWAPLHDLERVLAKHGVRLSLEDTKESEPEKGDGKKEEDKQPTKPEGKQPAPLPLGK